MRRAKSGLVRLLVRETHLLKDAMALADEMDVLSAIVADYGGVVEGFRGSKRLVQSLAVIFVIFLRIKA